MDHQKRAMLNKHITEKRKVIILAALLSFFVFYVVYKAPNCSVGFISGYTAAVNLIKGEPVAQFYKSGYFINSVQEICPGTIDIYTPNIPTYSLMMVPLSIFSYSTAKIIWTCINLLFLTCLLYTSPSPRD